MNVKCIKCYYYNQLNEEKFLCYKEDLTCPGYYISTIRKEEKAKGELAAFFAAFNKTKELAEFFSSFFTKNIHACACTTDCYTLGCSIFWEAFLQNPNQYDKDYLIKKLQEIEI